MTRYFYSEEFVDDGEVKGPETIQRLRELRFENEITDLCKVCAEEEGEGNWTNLAELLGDGTAVVQADKAVEQEDQRQKELPPLDEAMIDAICNEGKKLRMDERQKKLEKIQRNIERRIRGDPDGKDKAMYVGILVLAGLAFFGVCVVLYTTTPDLKLDEKVEKGIHRLIEATEPRTFNGKRIDELPSIEQRQLREMRELKRAQERTNRLLEQR